MKPFFMLDKCNKMMLSENDQLISDETIITDTMNKHIVNITKKLKLKPTKTATKELALSEILYKYKDHQSIVKMWPGMAEKVYLHSNLSHLKKY